MEPDTCTTCIKYRESGGHGRCHHFPQSKHVAADHWCWQHRPNHPFPTGVTEDLVDQVLSDERTAARMMLLVMNRLERL